MKKLLAELNRKLKVVEDKMFALCDEIVKDDTTSEEAKNLRSQMSELAGENLAIRKEIKYYNKLSNVQVVTGSVDEDDDE